MNPDILDQVLPHWVMDVTSVLVAIQILATIIIRYLWPPPEINWKPYTLFYKLVERLAYSGRVSWIGNGNPPIPKPNSAGAETKN